MVMTLAEISLQYQEYLSKHAFQGKPENLYQPMQYIMQLGGKRVRPLLALAGARTAGAEAAMALPIAHAIEVFHNFTLVHDDIMDNATERRGKPVVHLKWDQATAILSGDNMLVAAMEHLLLYEGPNRDAIMSLFLQTAREVCEGQQFDMDFSKQDLVQEAAYLEMIRLKTAVLLGCSLQCGAMSAGLTLANSKDYYEFAMDLGLAFQLTDDWLDTFGDPALTGKKAGGDIAEGKKTWLYIKAAEMGLDIQSIFAIQDENVRITEAVSAFKNSGLDEGLRNKAGEYYAKSEAALENIRSTGVNTQLLEEIKSFLTQRTH